jgi:hypothetical protein
MFVFEQLVFNVDDKSDHFRLRETTNSKFEFFVADHGHTFHCWRPELQDPLTVETAPTLLLPSSQANEYRVQRYSQLAPWVRNIGLQAEASITNVLGVVFQELEEISSEDPAIERFLVDRPRHETIIKRILQARSRNLDLIIRQKCAQTGISLDLDQSNISMVSASS